MGQHSANPKLHKVGVKLAQTFPNADRVAIYAKALNTNPMQEIWCKGSPGEFIGMDGERVIGTCQKKGRPVLITDADKDPLLRGVEKRHFSSCMCIPVLDDSRSMIGLLYLTSDKSKEFSVQGRFAAEGLAREVSEILQAGSEVDGETDPSPIGLLSSPSVLISLASVIVVMLMLVFVASSGGGQKGEEVTSDSSGAREAGRQFARYLRMGEFAPAWELLDPELQQSWSMASFRTQMEVWTSQEINQRILLEKKLSGLKFRDGTAHAIFYPTGIEGDTDVWEWELKKLDGQWRLIKMDGGPVKSPKR